MLSENSTEFKIDLIRVKLASDFYSKKSYSGPSLLPRQNKT